jgi:hypothetical protein
MAHSGFPTRKQENEYDKNLLSICELLSYKVMELVKVLDHAGIDIDESPVSSHKHLSWTTKFFENFRHVYKLEKSKYQEPNFVSVLKPLGSFLHER